MQAGALAYVGDKAGAQHLCRKLGPMPKQDAGTAALVRLNCAEAALAAGDRRTSKELAPQAEATFSTLKRPESRWRACVIQALAMSGAEAASKVIACDAVGKVA